MVENFENRNIKYAFHDIDGTHSLIREWPPVMSICLYDVIVNGVPEDFDSKENEKRLIEECGTKVLPETDRFCIESAGLSALTQMEWAIRRAVEEKTVKINCDMTINSEIIKKIWAGEELFDYLPETKEMKEILTNLNVERNILVVVDELDENLILAARNLENVLLLQADEINTMDIISAHVLIATEAAIKSVEEALK